MELNEYQAKAHKTAVYPRTTLQQGLNYTIMKLGGEVGELQNKFGKVLRGDQGALQKFCDNAPKELGDVLWYVSETCYQLGLALDRVAADNLAKLAARQVAGTLKGSGDDR